MLKRPKNISVSPGVYIFRRGPKTLYIGKAANLRSRVSSYFQDPNRLSPKIRKMMSEATRVGLIKVGSEIEALIREAELIKQYRPRFNVLMRDDKAYCYVGITKEEFPRVFITHAPEHDRNLLRRGVKPARFIGPFTSAGALREALKSMRRVFSYCTCTRPHKRLCLNSQIGRCYGVCCTIGKLKVQNSKFKILRREYRRNIQNIAAILNGRKTRLSGELKQRMRAAAERERYEEAARLRDQIAGLEDVFLHRPMLRAPTMETVWEALENRISALLGAAARIHRIEGYDISNIQGMDATGSMVVFQNGIPLKSGYRKFKIRTVRGANDTAMHQEVLRRRFAHPEWPPPNLIVIDGGKPQMNAALAVLRTLPATRYPLSPPVVTALAKREEELYVEGRTRPIRLRENDPRILHLFQRIRDESHRFARAYHHKLRTRSYAETTR